MSELLVPFGIHRDSGEIVEPEDAKNGRECNCLCPGCKAPLLSRHPKNRRIHFAHDSRHPLAIPEEDCPLSSAVAVAMMIRELGPSYVGCSFKTPALSMRLDFECCSTHHQLMVARESSNKIDSVEVRETIAGVIADLAILIGRHLVLVNLTYRGKLPAAFTESHLHAAGAALIEIDCDSFSMSSFRKAHRIRFSDAVREFVLSSGKRTWLVHPRSEDIRSNARQRHVCTGHAVPLFELREIASASPQTNKHAVLDFQCVMCNTRWKQNPHDILKCPTCNTHLYARQL